jgi:arsenical pump membrane protein
MLSAKASDTGVLPILRGVGWDVIVFVVGIFIVARAVQTSGLVHAFGHAVAGLSASNLPGAMHVTGFTAAGLSAVMNNHPTADMLGLTLASSGLPHLPERMLALSALIGADLGPKMLPIGSLAALMWFRILRQRGVDVSYGLYVRIGVPVTLAAILLALLTLCGELWIYRVWA